MTEVVGAAPRQAPLPGMPPRGYAASPSRLLAFLDCPRRYRMRYLDRPPPPARAQRAHTTLGLAAHAALARWWDLDAPDRTPSAGGRLVREAWSGVGFRDAEQSARWRRVTEQHVTAYLVGVDPTRAPTGVERSVAFAVDGLAVNGRVDRLDDRDGELVVVDYKTSRAVPTDEDARTSLPLALYAAAVWRMWRRRCVRVELHHLPTGAVAGHTHTPESLTRKLAEARSIARDARDAEDDLVQRGPASTAFPAVVTPLCRWCDFRAACPEGQAAGPEQPDWAALEEPGGAGAR
ncbi:MAG TPA: PD-(D/E)XK nuclease family protein [Dermatophilaceae bacterium]|nr:PD-(D/E)XK nuclease family protein [Dermatophilaceae bacterium]